MLCDRRFTQYKRTIDGLAPCLRSDEIALHMSDNYRQCFRGHQMFSGQYVNVDVLKIDQRSFNGSARVLFVLYDIKYQFDDRQMVCLVSLHITFSLTCSCGTLQRGSPFQSDFMLCPRKWRILGLFTKFLSRFSEANTSYSNGICTTVCN